MRKRANVISVPESWIEECRAWRKEQGFTIERLGRTLAKAIDRDRTFSGATLRRYLRGARVTDELTDAFARARGVLPPVLIQDARQQEWHELGVQLEQANAEVFESELIGLRQLVAFARDAR